MEQSELVLQVFFEDPFWVGVFQRRERGTLSVSKVTFGAEPRDAQVYELICREYSRLTFSPPVAGEARAAARNPKRIQREARRQMEQAGIGTKSQQALQLQREQWKTERRQQSREEREAETRRRFALRQQKKRDKHRGK